MKSKRVVIMAVLKEVDTKAVLVVDMGAVATEDIVEGEVDPPSISIMEKLIMYHGFVPNHVCFMHTTTIMNLSQRNFLN
jgi:hypothetical protein